MNNEKQYFSEKSPHLNESTDYEFIIIMVIRKNPIWWKTTCSLYLGIEVFVVPIRIVLYSMYKRIDFFRSAENESNSILQSYESHCKNPKKKKKMKNPVCVTKNVH